MNYLLACSLLIFHLSVCGQPKGVVIDGIVTYPERIDTVHSRPSFVNDGDILLRKDSAFLYLGINNGSYGSTNLLLLKDDTCTVIHISGSLGRAIYKKVAPDSFMVVKPILWVTRNPEAWDFLGLRWFRNGAWVPKTEEEIRNGLSDNLVQHGYTASTVDMGSFRDIEAIISRSRFRGYRLLVQYRKPLLNTSQLQSTMALFPFQPGLNTQQSAFRMLLDGVPGTSVRLVLSGKDWYEIN